MLPFVMACLFPESMNAFRAHPATALSANTQGVKGQRAKLKTSSRSLDVILFGGGAHHQVVLIFRLYLCWILWLLLGIPKWTTVTWFELPWQLNISTSYAMHWVLICLLWQCCPVSKIPGTSTAGNNSSHRHYEHWAITSSLSTSPSVCLFLSQPPLFLLSSTTPSHRKPGLPENKRRERGKGHGQGRTGGGG